MPKRVSNEELAAAMAAHIDENGVDQSVVELTRQMSPEARAKSDENIRRWVAYVRKSLKNATHKGIARSR